MLAFAHGEGLGTATKKFQMSSLLLGALSAALADNVLHDSPAIQTLLQPPASLGP